MRIIAIFGFALLLPTFGWAGTGDHGHKHKTFSAGTPGDPSKRARTVEVTMREADGSMSFASDRIEVRRGEQIKFALKNAGLNEAETLSLRKSAADRAKGEALQAIRRLRTEGTRGPEIETARVARWCQTVVKPLVRQVIDTHDTDHVEIDQLLEEAKKD